MEYFPNPSKKQKALVLVVSRASATLLQCASNVFSTTYSRSLPLHSSSLGGMGSEFPESQRLRRSWEIRITEKLPLTPALTPERLEVLVQVFVGVLVGAETCSPSSLLGQSGCHSRHGCAVSLEDPNKVRTERVTAEVSLRKFWVLLLWAWFICHATSGD